METTLVLLPKIDPDLNRATNNYTDDETDSYWVVDRRPVLNEYYIDIHTSPRHRSIQIHTQPRHIINHKKDYRWKYCCVVVASTNPKFKLPSKPPQP